MHFNIREDPKMQNFVLVGLIRSQLAQHQDAMHVKSFFKFSMAMSMSLLKKETYNFESSTQDSTLQCAQTDGKSFTFLCTSLEKNKGIFMFAFH